MSSTPQPQPPRVYLAAHHFDLLVAFTEWSQTQPLGNYTQNLSNLIDLLTTYLHNEQRFVETLTSEAIPDPDFLYLSTRHIQALAHTGAKVQLAYISRMHDLKILFAEAKGVEVEVVEEAFDATDDPRQVWERDVAREARRTQEAGRYLPAPVDREVVLREVVDTLAVPEFSTSGPVTTRDVDRLRGLLNALALEPRSSSSGPAS